MRRTIALALFLASSPSTALEVPVDDLGPWVVLSFNNIQPNKVSVSDDALLIEVRSSASPLIYQFDQPLRISGLAVRAEWQGALQIPAGAVQGEEGADDFVLKFGIVEAGSRRLNWFQRRIAADWIKQLFKLAPAGSGVDRINFLSTTQQQDLLWTSRQHPLSDLLYESRITLLDAPGPFELNNDFPEPIEVLGVWVSVDGDDTGSDFDLRIDSITLRTE